MIVKKERGQIQTTNRPNKEISYHYIIGFGDVDFKMKLSTLVVTLIWKGKISQYFIQKNQHLTI